MLPKGIAVPIIRKGTSRSLNKGIFASKPATRSVSDLISIVSFRSSFSLTRTHPRQADSCAFVYLAAIAGVALCSSPTRIVVPLRTRCNDLHRLGKESKHRPSRRVSSNDSNEQTFSFLPLVLVQRGKLKNKTCDRGESDTRYILGI